MIKTVKVYEERKVVKSDVVILNGYYRRIDHYERVEVRDVTYQLDKSERNNRLMDTVYSMKDILDSYNEYRSHNDWN